MVVVDMIYLDNICKEKTMTFWTIGKFCEHLFGHIRKPTSTPSWFIGSSFSIFPSSSNNVEVSIHFSWTIELGFKNSNQKVYNLLFRFERELGSCQCWAVLTKDLVLKLVLSSIFTLRIDCSYFGWKLGWKPILSFLAMWESTRRNIIENK